MININYTLKAMDYSNVNKNLTCMTPQEFKTTFYDYCRTTSFTMPAKLIIAGLLLNIVEYFVFTWALKNPDEILIDKKLNEIFYIKFTRLDIPVQIAVFKYILIISGLIMLYLGAGVYG